MKRIFLMLAVVAGLAGCGDNGTGASQPDRPFVFDVAQTTVPAFSNFSTSVVGLAPANFVEVVVPSGLLNVNHAPGAAAVVLPDSFDGIYRAKIYGSNLAGGMFRVTAYAQGNGPTFKLYSSHQWIMVKE